MPVIWPPTLPAIPLIEGYQETAPTMVRRSVVDQGPPKVARRYTAALYTIACRYAMDTVQLGIFDQFYWGAAGGGSVIVEWPHPWRHVAVSVRFKDPWPSWTSAGHPDVWYVSVTLEVLPPGVAAILREGEEARAALLAAAPAPAA
jgi:hypothetical protein